MAETAHWILDSSPMETERPSPRYTDIDVWEPTDILDAMVEGQFAAVAAVHAVRPALAEGGARASRRGYARAAGSSMQEPGPPAGLPSRTAPS